MMNERMKNDAVTDVCGAINEATGKAIRALGERGVSLEDRRAILAEVEKLIADLGIAPYIDIETPREAGRRKAAHND